MSKPLPARYCTTIWSSDTASLRKRGSLLIWSDMDMTWLAPPDGSPVRPAVFSDAAIQLCLTIKVLFKLPLRQSTGMAASLLKKSRSGGRCQITQPCAGGRMRWDSGPSGAAQAHRTLAVQIPYRRADGPLNLLVPSRALLRNTLPGNEQHWHQVLGQWRRQARKH